MDFVQIDKMALKIGMEYDNEKRIRSGIKYALLRATYNGHCAVLYDNLVTFTRDLLGVSEDAIDSSVINIKAKEEIYIEQRNTGDWIYLATYYKAVKNIAEKLNLSKEDIELAKIIAASLQNQLEEKNQAPVYDMQEAVEKKLMASSR